MNTKHHDPILSRFLDAAWKRVLEAAQSRDQGASRCACEAYDELCASIPAMEKQPTGWLRHPTRAEIS